MRKAPPPIAAVASQLFQEFMPIAMIVRDSGVPPDEIIEENYLRRWWLAKIGAEHDFARLGAPKDHTRPSQDFNLYLHCMTGSDKSVMHDHPWPNASMVLSGKVAEHTPLGTYQRGPGDVAFRRAEELHRLELVEGPAWTLFVTGRKIREWGFLLANGRWAPWAAVSAIGPDGIRRYLGP